jgi:hypothetical protein
VSHRLIAAPTTCGHGGRTAAIHLDGRYCHWCYRNAPQLQRPCGRCIQVDHLIAALKRPVTHSDIDEMGTPRSVSQVRSLLVDLGVLPPRDEYSIAVQVNAREELASLPHRAYQLALRRFFRWQRQRRNAAPLTLAMAANDRTQMRVIGSLLRAFNVEGFTIATGEQRILDAWTRATPTAFRARRFLRWCARSGINRHLMPPAARPSTFWLGGRLTADNESALARVLVDDTISPRMRLAVLLTTVYAVRAHRSAALRLDALRLSGGRPYVRLGTVDAELPKVAAPRVQTILRGMPARCCSP